MEPSNCSSIHAIPAASAAHTRVLLEELQVVITRLQSQVDEVSHHLDITLSKPAGTASHSHIATLSSLKKSLQTELNNNLATLHALG